MLEVFSFFNDSFIVMADYNDDSEQEHVQIDESGLSNAELPINKKETEVPNDYVGDGKDSRVILKVYSHSNIFGCTVDLLFRVALSQPLGA